MYYIAPHTTERSERSPLAAVTRAGPARTRLCIPPSVPPPPPPPPRPRPQSPPRRPPMRVPKQPLPRSAGVPKQPRPRSAGRGRRTTARHRTPRGARICEAGHRQHVMHMYIYIYIYMCVCVCVCVCVCTLHLVPIPNTKYQLTRATQVYPRQAAREGVPCTYRIPNTKYQIYL